ncbi:LamG domain-containing protein [Catenulispora yoronensis]
MKGGEVATKSAVIDTTKSFTISLWMNQTGLTTPTKYSALFSQDGAQNFAFTFSYSTEAKNWSFVRADNDATTPTTIGVGAKTAIPLNSWHQLTGVYDAPAGTIAFYVDGALQGTAKTGSAPYAATGPFAIGRSWYQKYPSNPFNGYISDVRVYSHALTAAEVKAL